VGVWKDLLWVYGAMGISGKQETLACFFTRVNCIYRNDTVFTLYPRKLERLNRNQVLSIHYVSFSIAIVLTIVLFLEGCLINIA